MYAMRCQLLYCILSMLFLSGIIHGHPGHDARHVSNWLGLDHHDESVVDGYLGVVSPISLRYAEAPSPFDRADLIPFSGLGGFPEEEEPEPIDEADEMEVILAPEPEPVVEEVLIERAEPVEEEVIEAPISQENINAVYSETGILNPDEILLYLRNITPNEEGGGTEEGAAFRFELPQSSAPPLRGEATLERTP